MANLATVSIPSTLFPILPSGPTGMARLAAQAAHADDGHLIEFKTLEARSILNKSVSKRQLWMAYSINPYRGCEFGCKYCYARYTHEFLQPVKASVAESPRLSEVQQPFALAFEREIYLKDNAAWLLEQELKKIDPRQEIALGTATDPYQPIERRVGITRSLLEVFAKHEGFRLGIVTKSTLIARDIDLLTKIAAKNRLVVHLTITSTDSALTRILEPRAPRPDLRFATVRKLRDAGIVTGVLCSPLLPGITDNERALDSVAKKAAAAGASFFAAQPLFLKSCSRPTYLSFVREHFPHLAGEYAQRFAKLDFADAPYRSHLALMVKRVCHKHGLPERFSDALLTRDASDIRKAPTGVRGASACGSQGLLFA
ncbi:MAG: radical SAM protein [Acidobacteriaceae bacterium]